ncbi:MAG: caspase family protein [Bacteroidaceae bacterium]|nr:caspase family protein [Bacteroidaceae bacterium]
MRARTLLILLSFICSGNVFSSDDVDTRIPLNSVTDEKTFVLVLANEHYKHVAPVRFAENDGELFALYCQKALGVPEKNIHRVTDATKGDMEHELGWLQSMTEAYKGEARVIFYYSGHGMPDESSREAFLLPVDAYATDPSSGYSTTKLYKTLSELQTTATIVFLDACFSGAQRGSEMLVEARSVAIKPKAAAVAGKMVVFSAATGQETAYPYKEKGHGLFTYFVLQKLQEKQGCLSLGELVDDVKDRVSKTAPAENDGKPQTPTLSSVAPDWRSWMTAVEPAKRFERRVVNKPKDETPATPAGGSATPADAKPFPMEDYTLEGAGTGLQGTYLVTTSITSPKNDVTDEQLLRCAIHGVLFRGFNSTANRQRQRPLAGSAEVETQQVAFFSDFFSSGDFKNYGQVVPDTRTVVRVGKQYSVTATVSVAKEQLRKDLQQKGIIKGLGGRF